ncbi:alpha-amylase family glycosyl hydrolase [Alteromonas oceanisediminis]|uniref:alpha-amylase family glycosyl hydrolase n=1 Tax=Alteromonas oceanisediminis TaxID=2836180 RepID=UPI001BDB40ED|nr:alpha-amylase family glycosyl hydrolase [Alteromonas oceanisediminis]MBT0586977.1 alpha-amylase [Alteromonas oceanisediminis]
MVTCKHTLVALGMAITFISGCKPTSNVSPEPQNPTQAAQQSMVQPKIFETHQRDVRDDVFYFVLPDRFYNANPDNDNGSDSLEISRGGLDVTSKWAFHGGDMQGIEAKLDYLQNLGVTAIWMTPILRNQAIQLTGFAHHGYWILDFTQIDPHFGSNDDLKSLIDAAHQRGLKIFFDIITNHTADVIRYEECHNPDGTFKEGNEGCEYKSTEALAAGDTYTPFIPDGLDKVKTPDWLNDPQYYHNQGDSFWQGESALNGDFVGLDDLKTSHPRVVEGMIDIYKDIITEFKPDGFRIDTVKHVDLSFWQQFTPAIMAHAKSLGIDHFHVFGEVYDGNPAVLSRYTTLGQMPSVLDFGMQYAVADTFYRDGTNEPLHRLLENDDYYNDADSDATLLMNFLGNHDMGRAGMFLRQAQKGASDEELVARNLLSHAFMYLSRGIPVIYYGDEQGFTGDGGDVDARENMFPSRVESYNDNELIGTDATTADSNFDQSHPLYLGLGALAKLRQEHTALRYGHQQARQLLHEDGTPMAASTGVFAFSRIEPNELIDYLALFNPSGEEQTVTVAAYGNYQPIVAGKAVRLSEPNTSGNAHISITLPPFSYALYQTSEAITPAEPVSISLTSETHDNERVQLRYTLDFAGSTQQSSARDLPAVTVSTYLVRADGSRELAASDFTAPYQAIIPPALLEGVSEIEVVAEDSAGTTVSHRATLNGN